MAGGVALPQQLHTSSGEWEGEANARLYGTGENARPHGTEIAHPRDAGENVHPHGTGGTIHPHGTEQNVSEKSDIWNGRSSSHDRTRRPFRQSTHLHSCWQH